MINTFDTCQQIYKSFNNNRNFNFKKFTEDKLMVEIFAYGLKDLEKEWRLNEPLFYNEFKDKIDIEQIVNIPQYYMRRLEELYNNLTLIQIKMFYITSFKNFKALIDKQVIEKLKFNKVEKDKFIEIEKEINKDCIIEKDNKGNVVKKYFNIDILSTKLKLKPYRIYEILKEYSGIEYCGIHGGEYNEINYKNIFLRISNNCCHKHNNIYVLPEVLNGKKAIRMVCTKCFREFYIIASTSVLNEKWNYSYHARQQYKKESTLKIFGYEYNTPKKERMEILQEITDKNIWDKHGISSFLNGRIRNANSRELYDYAQSLEGDLRDYCTIYGLPVNIDTKFNNKYN